MKHIIDTDELEKLPKYTWSDVGPVPCNRGDYVHIDNLRALIANSPQADGINATREELDRFLRDMRDVKPNPKAQETLSRGRAILRQMEAQADGMVLGEPITKIALNNTILQKRISVLEDLLSSAYNIANRNGENTHWERFAGQLHINGISPITAKTFKILPSDTELSAYKPQADDVRKDAERFEWVITEGSQDIEGIITRNDYKNVRQAIDKARD